MIDMNSAGIYRITIIRGEGTAWRYIGHASVLRRRKSKHLSELRRGVHKNQRMQRAFAKYGETAFVFEALEECVRDREVLEARETAILAREITLWGADSVINVCLKCVGSKLGVPMAAETKAKIGAANKGKLRSPQHRDAVRKRHLGRKHSEVERAKRSASMTGKKFPGRLLTEEHKRHVGDASRGKKRPREVVERWIASRRKNAAERGYWISPEAIFRTAEANRGRRHSEAHKRKIAKSLRDRAAELNTTSVAKPWLAEGISRTTWYRRRRSARG